MALTDTFQPDNACIGSVSEFGVLSEVVDRIEAFLREALPSVLSAFAVFRKESRKLRNEKDLCAELGKRLNFAAHSELFSFYPEDPENETATRTLDYGAYPRVHIIVGSRLLGAMDRLYAIEAKRLPTHSSTIEQREREREYVVGDWHVRGSTAKRLSGDIERFKEGRHGADIERAAMIGFVQKQDSKHWYEAVNRWIRDLITVPLVAHQATWEDTDLLQETPVASDRVSEFQSIHVRWQLSPIKITHFWLLLQD